MPAEPHQPKLYRVWHRPHGGSQGRPRTNAGQEQNSQTEQQTGYTEPSCSDALCKTDSLGKWQPTNGPTHETEGPFEKPREGEGSQRTCKFPESHRPSVRFSPTVCLVSVPSVARTPSLFGSNLSHNQKARRCIEQIKCIPEECICIASFGRPGVSFVQCMRLQLQCSGGISKRSFKEELDLYARTRWSLWKGTSCLADSQDHPPEEMNISSKRPGSLEGTNSNGSLDLATSQTDASSGAP